MASKYDLYTEGKLTNPDAIMRMALERYEIAQDQDAWKDPPKKNRVVAMVLKEREAKKPEKVEEESSHEVPKRGQDAWKKDPPENNVKTKVRQGKTYNWCKCHKMWVIHDPASCTFHHTKKKKKQVTIQSNKGDVKPRGRPKVLKVNPVLQPIKEKEDKDNDDTNLDDE
jgi:hypothetical protein